MGKKAKAPRRPFSEVDLRMIREEYPNVSTELLAQALDRTVNAIYQKARDLGLFKSAEYLASPAACRMRRGDAVGSAYRFPKGHVPANKGLRRPGWSPGGMAKTQFKKGQMPHTWVPVGSYRINGDRFVEVKFSDVPGPYTNRWVPVHRQVWIEANGPIPAGHVVAFKPGRHTTDPALITIDALELLTLAENLKRNSLHRYPPEIVKVIQLRGAITRQINKRAKAEEPHEQ
jgi:hypothetical protein